MSTSQTALQHPIAAPVDDRGRTLRLPRNLTPPRLDAGAWGGRFPDQRYYPFYLANGRDAMLMNISGSGDGHWERSPSSADVLSKLHSAGWFKADRRIQDKDCGVYGPLICLGEFTASPIMRNEHVVPRNVRQYFDPKTATLTTFYVQLDNRTAEKMELRMQSYLTSSGLMVQEIDVLQAPPCGVSYAFTIGTASATHQNHMVPLTVCDSCRAESSADNSVLKFTSVWKTLTSQAFSVVGGARVALGGERATSRLQFREYEQRIEPLFAGARFWRVVCFQDDREGGDPQKECDRLLEELNRVGLDGIRDRHLLEWEEYFAASSVELPDPSAQFLYDVSRYVIKANHHPAGFQPVGLLPYQWQGVMFWDAASAQEAFLTCGNLNEAKQIGEYILRLLPEARALADRLGNSGARLEWTSNLETFSCYEPPGRQFHNNAVWARAFCVMNEFLQEPAAEVIGPVEELLRFLIDEFQRHGAAERPDEAFVGIEESGSDPKPYDSWTCGVFLKALQQYLTLCRRHGVQPGLEDAAFMIAVLEEVLEKNIDSAGVLQSFRDGALPHWGSLVLELFPKHEALLPTVAAMAENYDNESDLFNFHGSNHYPEKAFPWANYWVARCLARAGQPESHHYFLHALSHINYFGGIPERIYYHGENYIEWFSTAHSALVLTVNTMLAAESQGTLQLLGGIDLAIWSDLAFRELYAGDGWKVSLTLAAGVITECSVHNLSREHRSLQIEIPPFQLRFALEAKPGENRVSCDPSGFAP